MTDQLDIIEIDDPICQSILHGPCRILNRDERPDEEIVGEVVGVRCGQLDLPPAVPLANEHLQMERHHPGMIVGAVRVVGFVESNDPKEVWSVGAAEWAKPDEAKAATVDKPMPVDGSRNFAKEVTQDPWYSDTTDVAWLLSDPTPCEPVEAVGDLDVWTEDEIRAAEKRAEKWSPLFDEESA